MRILAVVYCFPPLLVPAALCYLKLVLGLRANGAEVEVVAIDPRSFIDPTLVDPSIGRVMPEDLIQHLVWSPEARWSVRGLKRLLGKTPLGLRLFEPKKKEWTYAARPLLRRIDPSRFDVLLTCSQPHVNHLTGLWLRRWTRLPWVAYFSDPWTSLIPFASARASAYDRMLERRVLAGADHVLYTSEEMLRLAETDYAPELRGKSGVLPHSYVPEWYGLDGGQMPPGPRPKGRPGGSDGRPLRVLHTGHFYGPRSPAPLLRALERLHRKRSLVGRLEIDSYGNFPEQERSALERSELRDVFRVRPTIPYLDSLARMREADLLLLVDAKLEHAAESVFLPSKLVDYLGSGTPIFAVTPLPGCTARVLSEVGGIVCNMDSETEIEEAMGRLIGGEAAVPPDPAAIGAYHYVRVSADLLRLLGEVAGPGRTGSSGAPPARSPAVKAHGS